LLAPFDREFQGVFEIINMKSVLDIVLLEKSSIERIKVQFDHEFSFQDVKKC